MPLEYKTICIALYDYSAQDSEEISFKEDDILYILENDDEEWWKAKLKIANEEGEEGADGPIGVVPSNYIQEAECSAVMKALYDYDAQSDEELTFKENDILSLYDKDDPDWYLVKLNDVFGFVPAAFVEEFSPDEDEQPSESLPGNQKSLSDAISNVPEQNGNYVAPLQAYARKVAHQKSSGPFEVKTWSVSEYSSDKKKKKKKGTLSIGGDKIFYASESDKAPVQQWNINELSDVKYEKKRITISISGEKAAKFDFNTSKGDAEAIYNKIQESLARLELPTVKLDTPSRSSTHQVQEDDAEYEEAYEEAYEEEQEPEVIEDETEEVNEEDLPPPKFGIALYDFEAQGDDEITIHQGDRLWVIDDVSSKDWWTIRKGDEEGAVPSSYIEIRGNPDSDNAEEEKRLKLEEQIRIKQEEERLKKEEERLRKEEERLLKEEERRKREEKENERKRRDEEKRLQEEKKQKQALQSQTPPALPNRQPTRSNSPLDDEVTKKAQTPTNRASTERQIQTQTKSKPIPSKTRTWSDRTGAFKVEAQFLQYIDGKVHLHKLNGVKIAVPIERMSKSDLTYLEGITGEKFDDRTDDIPLAAIAAAHRGKATLTNSRKADYDWFNFFLKADIAHEDAFEYARAFVEEKLDESSIPDLNDELMKGLGVRVGDIIRIKKYVAEKHNKKRNVSFGATSIIPDEKTEENDQDYAKKIQDEEYERRLQEKRDEEFARELQDEENRIARSEGRTIPKEADLYGNLDSIVQKDDKKTSPKSAPLLFVESNGALKNNTKKARPSPSKAAPIQIDSSVLTVPKDKLDAAFKSSTSPAEKFEDDAWLSSDKTPVLLPKPIAKPVSTSPPPPPPPNPAVLQNSQIINSNPPVLPQPRQRSVSPLLSQQPQQPVTNTSISDFNSNSWNSNPNLPPAQNFQSSQMTLMTFQSSQMALQPPINTQTPSLPPAPLAAAVVPLNTILHQPLIPMKNEIPSQFSTLPITNINNLRNNNQGLMGNLPVNNYSPGNTWNNSGIVPTPLPVETHSGYSTLGVTNQFNANFNTENQIQPTLLNTPQLPPTTTQSSACDPKVVFAAMKTGQIGPNIIPNATDDKYSAFKQVDLQGPSVFNGPTPNQLSTNGYNLGQNPGVLNTPSWNQTATSGFSGMGVPQQNPSYPPLANPNVNFGLNGQQLPNQQGFNNTPGYNNLNQNHKW